MNTVWHSATPTAFTGWGKNGISNSSPPPQITSRPTAVPMRLKEMWITDTCFALRLTPMEDSSAVTQVPIFWPMIMGIAMP